MDNINFKIQLKEKDSIDFAKLHLFKAQKWLMYFFIAFTIIFIAMGIARVIGGSTRISDYIMIAIGPFLFSILYFRITSSAKKNFVKHEVGKLVMEYIFNEEGIEQKSEDYDYSVKWEKIYKVLETKTLIAIYVSKMRAMTIPKDKIANAQLDSLKKLMTNSIDAKKCNLN